MKKLSEYILMKPQFEGKKVFLIGSAPDPKIDYEKVKDHIWVTVKGSIWSIKNVWGLDRIPDYHFMTGHHINRFHGEMWKTWKIKHLVHLIATDSLRGEWQLIWSELPSKLMDKGTYEEMYNSYTDKGVEFDEFKILPLSDCGEGARRIVGSNYWIKTGRLFVNHLSLGVGLLMYILINGAEEVVLSGISVGKNDHSYTHHDVSSGCLKNMHVGEDMIALYLAKRFGWNISTFEPELNRACGIPMK